MPDYFDKPIYYCPHCNISITKSEELLFLSRNYQEGKFELNESRLNQKSGKCPNSNCGMEIEFLKLINGNYDHPRLPGFYFRRNAGTVYFITALSLIVILKFLVKWTFLPSFFVGLIGGLMAGEILIIILDQLSLAFRKR